ncbi:MAG: hypothetical protein K9N07_04125 [Candidatus Cloacimonetes bacterium]|nr:hypothetical protein [Candidatus Cloacimonadota bacterium]
MKKTLLIVVLILVSSLVLAQARIDVGTTIYNQFRWTDGLAFMGAHTETPWNGGRTDIHKGNFMRSEVQFEVNATISKYVKAYLRMKTIWDADDANSSVEANSSAWQTYWDANTGWFKLRGFRIDLMPGTEAIDQIQLGTPMGLGFSKWFMADRRYIDRDNAKGIYVKGHFGGMKWNLVRLWQPNWQGWNWNTGDFKAEDGTWALNFNTNINDVHNLAFDAFWFADTEFDPTDPENPNYSVGDDDPDGSMTTKEMYQNMGFGLREKWDISEVMSLDFNIMYTMCAANDSLDVDGDNIIDGYSGWEPVPQYASVGVPSGVFTVRTTDPFDVGFSPSLQFFYIDHNYTSMWGSRREDDMLMINGGIDALRNTYGERLGLNAFLWDSDQNAVRHEFRDNENLRLGEDLVESPVGYWGGTIDLQHDLDMLTIKGQFNYLGRTDDTGGATDTEDSIYDGDGTMYMAPHDFSGMVADLGLSGRASGWNWGLNFSYGMWEDLLDSANDADDIATTAMVVMPKIGKQITNSIGLELYPAYQMVTDEVGGEVTMEWNQIVVGHKWVYNLSGFDFWLRGEHKIYSPDDQVDATDDYKLSSNTLHAAFEVKF